MGVTVPDEVSGLFNVQIGTLILKTICGLHIVFVQMYTDTTSWWTPIAPYAAVIWSYIAMIACPIVYFIAFGINAKAMFTKTDFEVY